MGEIAFHTTPADQSHASAARLDATLTGLGFILVDRHGRLWRLDPAAVIVTTPELRRIIDQMHRGHPHA